MPDPNLDAALGSALGAGVAAVAGILAWRQRRDRLRRAPATTTADLRFFTWQDRRRAVGSVVLAGVGAAIVVGSWIDPKGGAAERRLFVGTWAAVLALLTMLVLLAVLDLFATARYARRHRQALSTQRAEALAEEARLRRRPKPGPPANGHGNGWPDPPGGVG